MRIAVIHIGAPTAGMNTATRTIVAYCLTKGHTPIAIYNVNDGRSDIGSKSGLPADDLTTTAQCFQESRLDSLLVISGVEALTTVRHFHQARDQHAAFRIPIVLLPTSMANNVPQMDYALANDTSLNTLACFCDVLRRMLYTPPRTITLDRLARDVEYFREQFGGKHGASRAGKLIIRKEHTAPQYSTEMVAGIIQDEAHSCFDARGVIPGHFQQGDEVSLIDWIRAFLLAIKRKEHLESFAGRAAYEVVIDDSYVAMIGIRKSRVLLYSLGGSSEVETVNADGQS
ncbi:hypothetical protein EYZ11_007877 [Aspergillus tanneri]|nr:hypothetical protein EYZ11_007877 [Aspergillus tanneri]